MAVPVDSDLKFYVTEGNLCDVYDNTVVGGVIRNVPVVNEGGLPFGVGERATLKYINNNKNMPYAATHEPIYLSPQDWEQGELTKGTGGNGKYV